MEIINKILKLQNINDCCIFVSVSTNGTAVIRENDITDINIRYDGDFKITSQKVNKLLALEGYYVYMVNPQINEFIFKQLK
jgi:hypothetical protein